MTLARMALDWNRWDDHGRQRCWIGCEYPPGPPPVILYNSGIPFTGPHMKIICFKDWICAPRSPSQRVRTTAFQSRDVLQCRQQIETIKTAISIDIPPSTGFLPVTSGKQSRREAITLNMHWSDSEQLSTVFFLDHFISVDSDGTIPVCMVYSLVYGKMVSSKVNLLCSTCRIITLSVGEEDMYRVSCKVYSHYRKGFEWESNPRH